MRVPSFHRTIKHTNKKVLLGFLALLLGQANRDKLTGTTFWDKLTGTS